MFARLEGIDGATTRSVPPAVGATITLCPTPVASSRANATSLPSGEIDGRLACWALSWRSAPLAAPVAELSGSTQTN